MRESFLCVRRYVYRAVGQHGQAIDVLVAARRDAAAARRFFRRALTTLNVRPTEVITDAAPVYPAVLAEVVPSAWHHVERHANNRVEGEHSQLKHRLRPMRGPRTDRTAQTIIAGHAFMQNGKVSMAGYGPYAASKFAMEAVSDALRNERRPDAGDTLSRRRVHQGRLTSDVAARKIAKAVTDRRPRTRYTIGATATFLIGVSRFLPDRMYRHTTDLPYVSSTHHRSPGAGRQSRASSARNGAKRWTHRKIVPCSTSTPRSSSNSSAVTDYLVAGRLPAADVSC